VFEAKSEYEIRTQLADDPWMDTILTVETIQPLGDLDRLARPLAAALSSMPPRKPANLGVGPS
jgi:hypothetical protein